MQRRVRLWTIWLQIALVISVLIAVAFWVFVARQSPSGKDDLKVDVSQLRSAAAEGQFFTEQILNQSVTRPFVRSHALTMSEELQTTLQSLSAMKVTQDLQETKTTAIALGTNLNTTVQSIPVSLDDQVQIQKSSDQFRNLFSQLAALETSLK